MHKKVLMQVSNDLLPECLLITSFCMTNVLLVTAFVSLQQGLL